MAATDRCDSTTTWSVGVVRAGSTLALCLVAAACSADSTMARLSFAAQAPPGLQAAEMEAAFEHRLSTALRDPSAPRNELDEVDSHTLQNLGETMPPCTCTTPVRGSPWLVKFRGPGDNVRGTEAYAELPLAARRRMMVGTLSSHELWPASNSRWPAAYGRAKHVSTTTNNARKAGPSNRQSTGLPRPSTFAMLTGGNQAHHNPTITCPSFGSSLRYASSHINWGLVELPAEANQKHWQRESLRQPLLTGDDLAAVSRFSLNLVG